MPNKDFMLPLPQINDNLSNDFILPIVKTTINILNARFKELNLLLYYSRMIIIMIINLMNIMCNLQF
jgi:hypothetical protein